MFERMKGRRKRRGKKKAGRADEKGTDRRDRKVGQEEKERIERRMEGGREER